MKRTGLARRSGLIARSHLFSPAGRLSWIRRYKRGASDMKRPPAEGRRSLSGRIHVACYQTAMPYNCAAFWVTIFCTSASGKSPNCSIRFSLVFGQVVSGCGKSEAQQSASTPIISRP